MISKDEVKHIAGLARIGLDEKETEEFSRELSAILDWVEDLKKAEVTHIAPVAHITGLENRMREDKAREFENTEGIMKLFPESKNGYDKVKSVL